jgi:hypothetical protein
MSEWVIGAGFLLCIALVGIKVLIHAAIGEYFAQKRKFLLDTLRYGAVEETKENN